VFECSACVSSLSGAFGGGIAVAPAGTCGAIEWRRGAMQSGTQTPINLGSTAPQIKFGGGRSGGGGAGGRY